MRRRYTVLMIGLVTAGAAMPALAGDAECAKLLGKNEYEYRTCLAMTRAKPTECASIRNETDRARCRYRAESVSR